MKASAKQFSTAIAGARYYLASIMDSVRLAPAMLREPKNSSDRIASFAVPPSVIMSSDPWEAGDLVIAAVFDRLDAFSGVKVDMDTCLQPKHFARLYEGLDSNDLDDSVLDGLLQHDAGPVEFEPNAKGSLLIPATPVGGQDLAKDAQIVLSEVAGRNGKGPDNLCETLKMDALVIPAIYRLVTRDQKEGARRSSGIIVPVCIPALMTMVSEKADGAVERRVKVESHDAQNVYVPREHIRPAEISAADDRGQTVYRDAYLLDAKQSQLFLERYHSGETSRNAGGDDNARPVWQECVRDARSLLNRMPVFGPNTEITGMPREIEFEGEIYRLDLDTDGKQKSYVLSLERMLKSLKAMADRLRNQISHLKSCSTAGEMPEGTELFFRYTGALDDHVVAIDSDAPDIDRLLELSRLHLGSVVQDHTLAPSKSQRLSLLHILGRLSGVRPGAPSMSAAGPASGAVLALNGPPGTGKSALMRSVVAALMVRAVPRPKEGHAAKPPAILASAATNQAVNNLRETFQNPKPDDRLKPELLQLMKRFVDGLLPKETLYACSVLSSSKTEKNRIDYTRALKGAGSSYIQCAFTHFGYNAKDAMPDCVKLKEWNRKAFPPGLRSARIRQELRTSQDLPFVSFQRSRGAENALSRDVLDGIVAEIDECRLAHDSCLELLGKTITAGDKVKRLHDAYCSEWSCSELAFSPSVPGPTEPLGRTLERDEDILCREGEKQKQQLSALEAALEKAEKLFTQHLFAPCLEWLSAFRFPKHLADWAKFWLLNWYEDPSIECYLEKLPPERRHLSSERFQHLTAQIRDIRQTLDLIARLQVMAGQLRSLSDDVKVDLAELKRTLYRAYGFTHTEDAVAAVWSEGAADEDAVFDVEFFACFDPFRLFDLSSRHLDATLRLKMFILSARYWEARFLFLKYVNPRDLHMISPCIVSTAHSAPRSLPAEGKMERYQFDLIIVEEAGQMTPEFAASLMTLGRNALFIGDTLQLEPIWSVPSNVDAGNIALYFGEEEDGQPLMRHRHCGNTSSMSSAMSAAQFLSAVTFTGMPARGMMLREHYRCHRDIIEYSDKLCYMNKLVCCKPQSTADRVYADLLHDVLQSNAADLGISTPRHGARFMHFDFGGSRADSNGSRANPQEAEKVVRLVCLLADQARAEDSYAWVCRSIAIVTPFTGQRGVILRALRAAEQRIGSDGSGSARFLRKHVSLGERSDFVVGTVHSLQGAEKPIVIMSAGYAAGERFWHFINKAPNFMNVAASRAQSAFVMACCGVDQNQGTPLGIALEHIEEIGKGG